jgi:tetratricopeptide (TPR) repeat protein
VKPWVRWALVALVAVESYVLAARYFSAGRVEPGSEPAEVAPAPAPAQGIEAVTLEALPDPIADAAGVLGGFRRTLVWQTQSWREDLGIEVHVVTLRSPSDRIEALATPIFEQRRIGEGAPSGGLLVLLNPARGEARIAVSYSLEHVFPDLIVGRVATGQLAPYAAYQIAGMAVMDVLHVLKDYAYLRAIAGDFALAQQFQRRPEYIEKARYFSGGAGARAKLALAEKLDRDLKAAVPKAQRARFAPAAKPLASVEAYLRTLREQVGDPTLDLYTPGSRCQLASYPYAPFEQLERLERAESSNPLRVTVQGDHAVADSEHPAHGFVPILLERQDGRWRVDLVETWKNLFFDSKGDYWQKNSNHPYAFALGRFGPGRDLGVAAWNLGDSDLEAVRRALAERGTALDDYLLGELLFRNCWIPVEALQHFEHAIAQSRHNLLFHEALADRAAYIGFYDLAVGHYAELGSAGLLPLARAQASADDADGAIASVRKALERDPFRIETQDLLRWLLEKRGDRDGAQRAERRIAEIRADAGRPDAAVALAFDPPGPILHRDAPVKVGDTAVYDHSFFTTTLANPSAREVEIVSVTLVSDGTGGRSGLGDIKDYWTYPAGSHRLRPGESIRFDKVWGFTEKVGHQQLRYAFDVCWKSRDGAQCRDYAIDLFPPFDLAGPAQFAAPAAVAKRPRASERTNRIRPLVAARLDRLALLRSKRFAELTRQLEVEQAAFEKDPSREFATAQMWDTFASADPALGPLLDAWAASVPSYAPHAALGSYHRRSGWVARGGRFASETPQARFAAMDEHFRRAREHLSRALELHPTLVVAYENLISMARAHSRSDELVGWVDRAAQICPSCVGASTIYLEALTPSWGGSHEAMERYVASLAPRIAKYPRLAVLAGAVAADRGDAAQRRGDYQAAVRLYDEALSHGDYWVYRSARGDALHRGGRYEEALADERFQLEHGRRPSEALLAMAYTLGKLKRSAEAAEAIDLARTLEPTNEEIAKLARWYIDNGMLD